MLFPISAALGTTEENTKLSTALDQLSEVYLKVEKVHEEQAKVTHIYQGQTVVQSVQRR